MQLQWAIINIVGEIRDFSTVLSIELKSKHYTGSKIFKFDANSKTILKLFLLRKFLRKSIHPKIHKNAP